ncbi:hypothetical protein ACI2KO_28965 [Pseudomonas piscis]
MPGATALTWTGSRPAPGPGSLTCLEDLLATVIAVKNGGELMEVLARSR